MTAAVLFYLVVSTGVFMGANSALKSYAMGGGIAVLAGALALFCLGNVLMVQVMRANGLGAGLSLSLIFQLVAVSLIAIFWFGERPSIPQIAGIVLGVIAVALIAWPKGGGA